MFDSEPTSIGLPAGEAELSSGWSDSDIDDRAHLVTVDGWNTGWLDPDRHVLPDGLDEIPVGLYQAAIVSSVDRSRLNGHDAVRLMQAEARLSSHHEAGKLAAMAEVVFSPPGDADSPVERSFQEVEYAAVEVAAALRLTRRGSESELNRAVSLTGRLHRVLEACSRGEVDLARVKGVGLSVGSSSRRHRRRGLGPGAR